MANWLMFRGIPMEITVHLDCARNDGDAATAFYAVVVAGKRINTVWTEYSPVAEDWIRERVREGRGMIMQVGVCLNGRILQLCCGENCLLFNFPTDFEKGAFRFFNDLLGRNDVNSSGMKMKDLELNLRGYYEIVLRNPQDLTNLSNLDFGRDSIDRITRALVSELYVFPVEDVHVLVSHSDQTATEKVKCATAEAYFCFLSGGHLPKNAPAAVHRGI